MGLCERGLLRRKIIAKSFVTTVHIKFVKPFVAISADRQIHTGPNSNIHFIICASKLWDGHSRACEICILDVDYRSFLVFTNFCFCFAKIWFGHLKSPVKCESAEMSEMWVARRSRRLNYSDPQVQPFSFAIRY